MDACIDTAAEAASLNAFVRHDGEGVTETRARQEALRQQLVDAHDAFVTVVNQALARTAESGDDPSVSPN